MADFANSTTLNVVFSGNVPSYPAPWVQQTRPEANAAQAITSKYRKWDAPSQTIVEMDQAEKDVVDAAIDTGTINNEESALTDEKAVHAQNLVLLDWINEVRAAVSPALPAYTYADFETEWRAQREAL